MSEYPYVWTRKRMPPQRQGQRCKIIGKSKSPELARVQFPKKQGGNDIYHVHRAGLVKLVDVEAKGGFKAWLASKIRRG